MEPLTPLGMLIGIVVIGYAILNIVFRLVSGALTLFEENRLAVFIVVVILVGILFGLHR